MLHRLTRAASRTARLAAPCSRGPRIGLLPPAVVVAAAASLSTAAPSSSYTPSSRLLDPAEAFLNGASSTVIESMFMQWEKDPSSVDASWAKFFQTEKAEPLRRPASAKAATVGTAPTAHAVGGPAPSESALRDSIKLMQLIRAYRIAGHLQANLDPLDLQEKHVQMELDPQAYGFSSTDASHRIYIGTELGAKSLNEQYAYMSLGEILQKLRNTYCRSIGVEYFHIHDVNMRDWITERMEHGDPYAISKQEKLNIFTHVAFAEEFENFLAQKYTTAKRFGLEGGESTISSLEVVIETAAAEGIESMVLGMAHRGRLNVLTNVMKKPYVQLFHEFKGEADTSQPLGSGDVKYHLGTSTVRNINGKKVHLSMTANPSHLEFVNPVVEGKVRAKQHFTNDVTRSKNMSILIHGDASFAGQGVVMETLAMADLTHYSTGGTIHIVINNQIGFTTDPHSSRSSVYATDVAKMVSAPIFHVNGDDPEAVAFVSKLAVHWRQAFKKDVVIDLICYRRHGHNELDQPSFTQPLMYKKIRDHPSTLTLYSQKLQKEGSFTAEELLSVRKEFVAVLEKEFQASKSYQPRSTDWLEKNWEGFKSMARVVGAQPVLGVSLEKLGELGMRATALPADLAAHPLVAKVYHARQQMIVTGKGLDWAMGEQLAYASLLVEGYPVRLSGQDAERGTFSHRHAVVHDQNIDKKIYVPLQSLSANQALFRVTNSHLSETAVLGFELGYSLEHPKILVLWEAQFGDFANGAQVIIDQFLESGEAKWYRQSGLTLLLPHGYDGQGPEHSSARLERFLQMSDEDPYKMPADPSTQEHLINATVANVTTPAQFFHLLRRQVFREFRKPLIVMSPKKLLRHRGCVSDFAEFGPDRSFRAVLPDASFVSAGLEASAAVKRVILCTGQVYFDLLQKRKEMGAGCESAVAIVRVEQLAPFPFHEIKAFAFDAYPNATEIVWAQEEPQNMGSWMYVEPRLGTIVKEMQESSSGGAGVRRDVRYVGRAVAAAPATGFYKVHELEQAAIVTEACSLATA